MRTEEEIRADAADERPFANGTEHDIWASRYCYDDCVHDDAEREIYCPIINVALFGPQGRPSWPVEWTRRYIRFGDETTADDPAGYPTVGECTEYERRRDPGGDDDPPAEPDPPPVCDGQLDLVDLYLPTALAELTPAPAEQVSR